MAHIKKQGRAALSDNFNSPSWSERLHDWFPDREFFMRSQGQVRFIKVSSNVQRGAALAVIVLALGWAGSMAVMGWNKYRAEADLASFADEKAQVASKEQGLEAYGGDIDKLADELKRQQDVLDVYVEMLPDDIQTVDASATDTSEETAEWTSKQIRTRSDHSAFAVNAREHLL